MTKPVVGLLALFLPVVGIVAAVATGNLWWFAVPVICWVVLGWR